MKAKVTIICENTASFRGGLGEHGFAVLIETEKGNFLFDTGRGTALIPNLLAFHKDPFSIRKILLSHGHHDHTGGLASILEILGETEVWAHPDIFISRYHISHPSGKEVRRFAGLQFQRPYLESLGARFNMAKDFREITRELFMTGEIPRQTSFETGDPNLFADLNGKLIPDPFTDDQSLVLVSPKGLVVVLGCAHAGMVNILNHVIAQTGHERIFAIIGGTHLDFASPQQIEETIRTLKHYKIERLGVSHCTGLKAAARLSAELGEKFFFGLVGESLEI